MPARIGIFGNYGHHNNGDEAILWGLLRQLAAWPEPPQVTVFSFDPDDTRRRHPHVEAVSVLVRKGGKIALLPTVAALYRRLRSLDLLIIGGGALLMDTFRNQALLYTGVARIARLAGVPVVYYAVGAGPIETALGRWLIRDSANRAAFVSVRDRESRDLLKAIGVHRPVAVVADPAFGLVAPPATTGEMTHGSTGRQTDDGTTDRGIDAAAGGMKAETGGLLPPRRPGVLRVGISAMPCYYPGLASDGDPARYAAYVEGMRTLTRGLLAMEVPTAVEVVYFGTKYPQDVETAKEILADMDVAMITGSGKPLTGSPPVTGDGAENGAADGPNEPRRRVWVLDRELEPQDLLTLMGELDMLIATRLHALILATVAGTPSIGIAYRSKVQAIFSDNGREHWTVSPEETDWPAQLLGLWREMAGQLDAERQAVRQMAEANRQAVREQVLALGRWVRPARPEATATNSMADNTEGGKK